MSILKAVAILGVTAIVAGVSYDAALWMQERETKRAARAEALKAALCLDARNRAKAMILCMSGDLVPMCITTPTDVARLRADNGFLIRSCGMPPEMPDEPVLELPTMKFKKADEQ